MKTKEMFSSGWKVFYTAVVLFTNIFSIIQVKGQTCSCTEDIYLAEPGDSSVLKFGFNADQTTIMLDKKNNAAGNMPWYQNPPGEPGLTSPHGITFDNQGYLYVGETGGSNSYIRRFTCGGVLSPLTGTTGTNGLLNKIYFPSAMCCIVMIWEDQKHGALVMVLTLVRLN